VAPGRLGLVVMVALPAAGFVAPEALLERAARRRAARLCAALPDALDLLAVGTAAGRSPQRVLGEISSAATPGEPLAAELAVTVTEIECGTPQRDAIAGLRDRVPGAGLGALAAALERSRRFGSPLAEQLHEQASSLRRDARRRVEEQAARAAPKIQLVVALVLVPSVLLMIVAGLVANSDALFGAL
jgi:tight adherence protein C